MIKNFFLGVVLITIVAACSSDQIVKNFPRSESIKMNEVAISNPLYSLGSMFTTEDYLVVYQSRMDTMFFSYYSLDDLHFVLGGGRRGQGPGEFTNSPNRNYFITEGNGFTSLNTPFFVHMDIEGEELNVVKKEAINTPLGLQPNNYSKIDENVYCITNIDISKPYEFILFDEEGENPVWISPYPNWANIKEEFPMFTYGSFIVANQNLKRFIVFYANFRRVRMFDSQGEMLKDISIEFPFKCPSYEEGVGSKFITYSIPYSDDNYIYVLCHNAMSSEIKESTELQIWNWNAEPIAILSLDKGLRQFTISPEKRKIYATDPISDVGNDKIYWCDLPDWLYKN